MTKKKKITTLENIELSRDGDFLVLRINTKKDCGISSTGKSILVATSHGYNKIENGKYTLNMNLSKKP